ncbi:MAG TPA: nucleotidyltransferase domain-containing protein [Candidatus Wallbacteria bacterium]|nr:MAG: Nucleotidyltransferase domain protein [bacterium ADurb.Bin243]HOD43028.1 nucleotidyltransferase domain-containing protein [Candidatus Wallbacteria bacterium]HPG56674.1 nucleotidyltransferase domain-containing protein [Candidatus Wallbacteria bacterium]
MSKDDILKILNTYKTEHAEQYGITKIGLFGSCARGANTAQSDIDVFVTMQKPNIVLLSRIRTELEELFKTHVDLVEYRERMNGFLKSRIDKEAVYA